MIEDFIERIKSVFKKKKKKEKQTCDLLELKNKDMHEYDYQLNEIFLLHEILHLNILRILNRCNQ